MLIKVLVYRPENERLCEPMLQTPTVLDKYLGVHCIYGKDLDFFLRSPLAQRRCESYIYSERRAMASEGPLLYEKQAPGSLLKSALVVGAFSGKFPQAYLRFVVS